MTNVDQLIVCVRREPVLRHVPARSIEHVGKKIVNGGKTLQAFGSNTPGGGRWKRDYELFLEKGERDLLETPRQYRARSLA